MAELTVVQWLKEQYRERGETLPSGVFQEAKEKEEKMIKDAIMYALDEDGHTGEWKIKFANDYYEALNKGYDIRNKNVQRFFGGKTI
jgi:hypothetical protein